MTAPEVTSPSSYILGGNAAAKRAALEEEVADLAAARKQAETKADQLDTELDNLTAIVTAATQLILYASWDELDHWASARAAGDLENRIAQLKAANVNLRRLQEQRDEAERTWEQLVGACGKTKDAIDDMATRKETLAARLPGGRKPPPFPMANESTSTRFTRGCARPP